MTTNIMWQFEDLEPEVVAGLIAGDMLHHGPVGQLVSVRGWQFQVHKVDREARAVFVTVVEPVEAMP